MRLVEVTERIARKFLTARDEPFKDHPLAKHLRDDWPAAARSQMSDRWAGVVDVKGSPGLGQWNEAPWLAFFHTRVTDTARAGFYPIFLFERGFAT